MFPHTFSSECLWQLFSKNNRFTLCIWRNTVASTEFNANYIDSIHQCEFQKRVRNVFPRWAVNDVVANVVRPPGYTSTGLFSSETTKAEVPTIRGLRRLVINSSTECLQEPKWEEARQEALTTLAEAARLVKEAQAAAYEAVKEEVDAAEALYSEEFEAEGDIDGGDGGFG